MAEIVKHICQWATSIWVTGHNLACSAITRTYNSCTAVGKNDNSFFKLAEAILSIKFEYSNPHKQAQNIPSLKNSMERKTGPKLQHFKSGRRLYFDANVLPTEVGGILPQAKTAFENHRVHFYQQRTCNWNNVLRITGRTTTTTSKATTTTPATIVFQVNFKSQISLQGTNLEIMETSLLT